MTEALDRIASNPSAVASLVAALIAASVALVLFILTQFLGRKKERAQFLTPKLEELYLLLNEVAEHNVSVFRMMHHSLNGDIQAKQKINALDDLDAYGHRTAKRIIMYIRLYFPQLSKIHQLMFAAQREVNNLIFEMNSGEPPTLENVISASGRVGHFIRLMEGEIIRNRDKLLSDHIFPKRYRYSTKAELEAEIPPPQSVVLGPSIGT